MVLKIYEGPCTEIKEVMILTMAWYVLSLDGIKLKISFIDNAKVKRRGLIKEEMGDDERDRKK